MTQNTVTIRVFSKGPKQIALQAIRAAQTLRKGKLIQRNSPNFLPSRIAEEAGIPNTAPTLSLLYDAQRPHEVSAEAWERLTASTEILVSWPH